MVFDFHSHTLLSDGELSPVEQVRYAMVNGYRAIALTEHAGVGQLEWMVRELEKDCAVMARYWDILVVPGVELTHLPARAIPDAARAAREAGARLVIVHGETLVEPVEPGTNRAAIESPDVDILAHPGLLTAEEARLAARTGTFIEISARRGHSLTNGHVVRVGREAGVQFLLNSDSHGPDDFLTADFARQVALGAGLELEAAAEILQQNPLHLLRRLGLWD